jgi:group I intron endonuclease
MIGIYKLQNPIGQIYIGSSNNISKRLNHYKSKNCKLQTKLYYSICEYGYENHVLTIIEECEIDQLKERERYWQDYYDVLNKGLNCMLVGTKTKPQVSSKEVGMKISKSNMGKKMSLEAREKIRSWHLGKTVSEETKIKLKNRVYPKGWNHSEEAKNKMSQKTKGVPRPYWRGENSPSSKKIINIASFSKRGSFFRI